MKKILFLAAALVAGIGAMAQEKIDGVIKVSTDKYDFGKIKQGVPVNTFFTITNTSDKPIVIESARAGCGCTTPEYAKEPIAPGGTTQLKVGYNAAALGRFDKAVNIKLAGVVEEKVVMIGGEVVESASTTSITKVEKSTPKVVATNDSKPIAKTKVKTKTKKVS